MITLALEFSSEQRSVALARGGQVLAEAAETGGRGTNAFALIEKVLAAASLLREDIEVIAVGLGPGSYTGIRAAIAVAQGWQLARGVKLLGISSVAMIAAQAPAAKCFGRVNVVVDAQRGEFYLATWEISETRWTEAMPLKIVAAAEITSRQNAGEICVGPEMAKKIFPSAAMIAQTAAQETDFISGEKLEPIYLRETTFIKAPPTRLPTA
ncbi:MAG TPA: tRNA (adenosine(37)-N6)-threonylcarbamoyltransferase complex dimerization subunit type 1 TsaB [Verrucomicrobiae bacterium]|jgi:tRNA threonylcarbamoyladenosine biosynthesis protein TsaB